MVWRHLLQKSKPFGCIEKEDSSLVFVGVPMDSTGTYRGGTRLAPDYIRDAACNIELYSLFARRSLENIGLEDLGNIVIPPGDLEHSLENIELVAKGMRDDYGDSLKIFIGGEHLISMPIVRALRDSIDTIVVFDAHLDARDEYLGSRLNHATFVRRLLEEGFRIIHIGSRALSYEEALLTGSSVENLEVYDIENTSKVDGIRELGSIYISLDMDVLDPSYAPGVSNPEPLGMSPRELIQLLQVIIKKSKGITGLDIVEVNPMVDPSGVTSILAAKIVLEFIGLVLARSRFHKPPGFV
ncbi:agmatinase [Thermogladius sp. 4427co]|uniref:agmatinase n=1 Tax=Thermogladius sp. 4427co TaxID=3450718 RepID=UPI003F78C095